MRTPRQSWALRGRGRAGIHILVFWALESTKMRGRGGSGSAQVRILVFWALENSKMRAPSSEGGGNGSAHFSVLGA